MRSGLLRPLALLLLALGGAAVRAEDDPLAAERAEFQRAYAAIDTEAAVNDSPTLSAYPLYPYLQSARLAHALLRRAEAPTVDKEVAAFLAAHDAQPVSRDLRRIWLTNLAERQQWSTFVREYHPDEASDWLQCHALHAQLALNRTKKLAPEVIERWLSPHASPATCDAAFDWLRQTHQLTSALIEKRAQLALEAGDLAFARELSRQLPAARGKIVMNEAAWVEHPGLGIDTFIARPEQSMSSSLMLSIWTRLTRKDADGARQRYDALIRAQRLDATQASPYARALALGLAWDRMPEARSYFAKIAVADRDDAVTEWSTRAALWAGDWPSVASGITAMTGDLRQQQRWQYFAVRADEQLHRGDAHMRYLALANDNGYYPALAAARAGISYSPHPQPLLFDETRIAPLSQRENFVRAHVLLLCGLRADASHEWQTGLEPLDADSRQQAIALAYRWGWYDQEVTTATRNNVFEDYSLLYPRPYNAEVNAAGVATGVGADLIYAIMRQESLYRADAVSHAGALGLLQLVPETARMSARRLQRPAPTREQLFDPAVNLSLGAEELRNLLDNFSGQQALAIAAYNAGPTAVNRWLPAQPHEADIWIENIPFNETRSYVQRVLWHSLVFGWLDSGQPQATKSWLQPVSLPTRVAAGAR
jgi:soluble lytic murein transglycosylase